VKHFKSKNTTTSGSKIKFKTEITDFFDAGLPKGSSRGAVLLIRIKGWKKQLEMREGQNV
jgi:hypothetical protein